MANKYGNNILQIEEFFGQYGDLGGIHRTNNVMFVRFLTHKGASSCLNALQHDHIYRVQPSRKKKSNTSGFQRSVKIQKTLSLEKLR